MENSVSVRFSHGRFLFSPNPRRGHEFGGFSIPHTKCKSLGGKGFKFIAVAYPKHLGKLDNTSS